MEGGFDVAAPGVTAAERPLAEGDVLDGRYRVARLIGAGGAGAVYECDHIHLKTRVAIKVLRREPTLTSIQRVLREARVVARLKGDHVARVTDVPETDGAPFIVMELLEGRDLRRVLIDEGSFAVADAVGCILQACEGLAEAHALGIVHRDVKPSNLFLARRSGGEPILKVLDFGIARALAPESGEGWTADLTGAADVVGTLRYMAPEQMRSAKDVDVRADIWALGAVLYELLGGRPPYEASSVAEMAVQVEGAPPSLRALRPEVPVALEEVVLRCLVRDRERRFADVATLAAALAPFGPADAAEWVRRIAATLGAQPEAAAPPRVAVAAERGPRRMASRRSIVLVGLGAVVLGGGAAVALAPGLRGREAAAATLNVVAWPGVELPGSAATPSELASALPVAVPPASIAPAQGTSPPAPAIARRTPAPPVSSGAPPTPASPVDQAPPATTVDRFRELSKLLTGGSSGGAK